MAILTHPQSQSGPVGQSITLTSTNSVSRGFAWSKNGVGIDGTAGTGTSASLVVVVASGVADSYKVAWGADGFTSDGVISVLTSESGTLVDAGFEGGTDGAVLGAAWTVSGTPQKREYDTARAKMGAVSALIQGPTTVAYAGVSTPAVMTADGAEYRFWAYFDTANQYRVLDDFAATASRPFSLMWGTAGEVFIFTSRTATGYSVGAYTQVGTYAVGWMQYRIVLNFTGSTMTLSRRAATGAAWTPLKASGAAGYDIPMRGATNPTTTAGLLFRAYQNANLWLDDVRHATSGITEVELSYPVISAHPQNTSVEGGASASFSVTAAGNPAISGYQWQRSTGGAYADIIGATSAVYAHTAAVSENGYVYRCVVTNSYASVTSNAATLTFLETSTVVQTMPMTYCHDAATYTGDNGPCTVYVMDTDMEATYLDSGASAAYHGNDATMKVGATATREYHALLKYFEGALPLGTVSAAHLHLYTTPTGVCDLRAYPLANKGGGSQYYGYVGTGWGAQSAYPTWDTRIYDQQGMTPRSWQTAGGTGVDEIDTALYSSLSIASGDGAAYRAFDIGATQMNLWLGDDYSQGVLVKHNAGSGDRYASFPAPGQTNGPVLVVSYSALSPAQLTGRKLTTDTYVYSIYPRTAKFSSSDVEHGFMVMTWCTNGLEMGSALISETGRVRRFATTAPTGGLHNNSPLWGVSFDASDGRYWTGGVSWPDGKLAIGYSNPYTPAGWTWVIHPTIVTAKSSIMPRNGVLHIFALDGVLTSAAANLDYLTYTRSTDSWGTATTVVAQTVATKRNLSSGIPATGAVSTVYLNGAPTSYPAFGWVKIDSEQFWYTGKSGNTLTGVTRAINGTTAAVHAASALVDHNVGVPTLTALQYDGIRDAIHVTWSYNRSDGSSSVWEYQMVGYLRHYFADAATVWKDQNDSALSLPIVPATIPLASDPSAQANTDSLLVNSHGDISVFYSKAATPDVSPSSAYLSMMVAHQAFGAAGWTQTNYGSDRFRMSGSEISGDNIVAVSLSGVPTANPFSQLVYYSADGGATFGAGQTLGTYDIARPFSGNSGISSRSLTGGFGLAYFNHYTAYGAIYLNAIELTATSPTGVTASADGAHIDLAWLDTSGIEDGFYAERSADGGPWQAEATLAPNTVALIDADPPAAWTTLQYRVAAYKGSQVGAWAYSNTLTSVSTGTTFAIIRSGGVTLWL